MTLKRILIAEDEKPIANALDLKLRSAGFETVLVHDGKTAISTLKKISIRFDNSWFSFAQKDGFFILAELKKLKAVTPVIVSSNLSQDEDIKRAKKHPAPKRCGINPRPL